jgi:hypothetical protein
MNRIKDECFDLIPASIYQKIFDHAPADVMKFVDNMAKNLEGRWSGYHDKVSDWDKPVTLLFLNIPQVLKALMM